MCTLFGFVSSYQINTSLKTTSMVKRQKDRHHEAGIIIKADSWSKCMVIGWSRWATIADSLGI